MSAGAGFGDSYDFLGGIETVVSCGSRTSQFRRSCQMRVVGSDRNSVAIGRRIFLDFC